MYDLRMKTRKQWQPVFRYVVLIIVTMIMLFPVYYLVVSAADPHFRLRQSFHRQAEERLRHVGVHQQRLRRA